VIEFEDVGFSYGQAEVLRDLSLSLAPGGFHFLTGPSGSGKTTLIRLCHLDLAPTRGRIRHFGQEIARGSRDAVAGLRQLVGVVPQRGGFLDHLPVMENVALPLAVTGVGPAERAEDIDALLEWVGLRGRGAARPSELSAGERQRAALARAVILSPEVILADEPGGGLDRPGALGLLALLVELNAMGKTVVVATHDRALVEAARERVRPAVIALRDGRLAPVEAWA
jgi:cell division transport system ATP-binding protein